MGILDKIKNFFGQAAAETGLADPYHQPRLSDDLLAEPTAEIARPATEAVNIHRTDIPPELPHKMPPRETIDGPLNFPDAADPPERLR